MSSRLIASLNSHCYNLIMNKLSVLLLVFLSTSTAGSDDTCTISGFVRSSNDFPLQGATVMIAGTSLGAMTDLKGWYVITEVPPGTIHLNSRMVGMAEHNETVFCPEGDTVFVDFTLLRENEPVIPSYEDLLNWLVFSDTLLVHVTNWQEVDMDHGQVWANEHLLPSTRTSDSTVSVLLPYGADRITMHHFPAQEELITITDNSPVVDIDFTIPAGEALVDQEAVLEPEFTFIDVTEWGDPAYQGWGFLGAEVRFTDDGDPVVLLVYNEHAVLIDGNGSARVINFPFPALQYESSAEFNYILVWDISGHNGITGDVAIVDMENGRYSVFDPDPYNLRPQRNPYSGGITTWPFFSGCRYHVTSRGRTVAVDQSYVTVFNSSGEETSRISLEEIGIADFYYFDQFLSLNESALSVVFSDGSANNALTVDLEGNLLNLSRLPVDELRGPGGMYAIHDPETAVIWQPMIFGCWGILRIDCLTGDCFVRDDIRTTRVSSSPNRQLLGLYMFSNGDPGYQMFQVWDWNTGELLSSIKTSYSNDRWLFKGVSAMSDNGYCAAHFPLINQENTPDQVFVADVSGRVLWASPILLSANSDYGYRNTERVLVDIPPILSPDGSTLAFSNGRYLVLTDFTFRKGSRPTSEQSRERVLNPVRFPR